MTADRSHIEQERFLPNPKETVPPPTERDAFEDAVRYMGTSMPRDQVRELVRGMGSDRIVSAVQGIPIHPPLNSMERYMAATVEYCMREGLVRSPVVAVGMLEAVRQDVLRGGVFVGQESKVRIPPPQQAY